MDPFQERLSLIYIHVVILCLHLCDGWPSSDDFGRAKNAFECNTAVIVNTAIMLNY